MESDENTPDTPEENNSGEAHDVRMNEEQRLRMMFRIKLVNRFTKALQESTEQFTWQEKTDFIEALEQYVALLREDRLEADKFSMEKILKVFRSKLQPAYRLKLFDYFEQELFGTGLEFLIPDVFEGIDMSEWEFTDEEYEKILNSIWYKLDEELVMHLVYGKTKPENETEQEPETLAGIPGLKGRMQRVAGDNLTRLSQEQTALFIELLRFGRIILNDEHLNAKQAGMAFHILTGYSADSLRIKMNKQELKNLKTQTNLTEIHNTLTRLTLQVESEIKELKRPKGS